jgi:hypothetical protein
MRVKHDLTRRFGALLGTTLLLVGLAAACSDDGADSSSETTAAPAAEPKPEEMAEEQPEEEEEAEVFDPGDAGMEDEDEQEDAAGDFMEGVEDETEALPDDDSYSGYVEVSDATGALFVEVPEEFTDVNGAVDTNGLPTINASTSIDDYLGTWTVSGLSYSSFGPDTTGFASSDEAFESTIGDGGLIEDNCALDSSETYTEEYVEYTVGYFLDCAGTDTDFGIAYIWLGEEHPILGLSYQLTSVADGEAFQQALATFDFDRDAL